MMGLNSEVVIIQKLTNQVVIRSNVGMYMRIIVHILLWNMIFALSTTKPHIVLVLADDLGYNDVGYRGKSAVITPCIDNLAQRGIRLENYYVQPICSPSRSQLLSGRYQIHTGLQHSVISPMQRNGLPIDEVLLPEQLRSCGYKTHMVGKWHVGFYRKEYTPWNRGFDHYIGILTGGGDYYSHTKKGSWPGYPVRGFDMYDSNTGPTKKYTGRYSTHLYTTKAKRVIQRHNSSSPLFLYLAHQAVHSPIQVPVQYVQPFREIESKVRRKYLAMVSTLDESICNITEELKLAGMWNNTVFVFSSDNGGQPKHGGNNWPLRGHKNTLWEGGIKSTAFVSGGFIGQVGAVRNQMFHISDWLPTLLSAAKCPILPKTKPLDGFNQWKMIVNEDENPRNEILHNIDPLSRAKKINGNDRKPFIINNFDVTIRAAVRVGPWKLITGYPGISGVWTYPPEFHKVVFHDNSRKPYYLFNIDDDPYEFNDVSSNHTDKVIQLLQRLAWYNQTAVPVRFPRDDYLANPVFGFGFWQPWVSK